MSLAAARSSYPAPDATDDSPAYRYHLLRAATERFQRNLPALDDAQRAAARAQAGQTYALEALVLGSAEAGDVVIAESTVEQSLQAVAARFEDSDAFEADLARNGLDTAGLKQALRRELCFDAVMQRVGTHHAAVTETDIQLFYELHQDRFQTPERRSARHILITVNADYAENTPQAARARAEALAAKLSSDNVDGRDDTVIERFASLARRHSECPTAMQDGKLGDVVRGQLYPEVDAALFALPEGAISAPVASELGFHILLCERIEPAQALAFAQVQARIRTALEKRRRREAQRAWLAALQGR